MAIEWEALVGEKRPILPGIRPQYQGLQKSRTLHFTDFRKEELEIFFFSRQIISLTRKPLNKMSLGSPNL